MKQNNRKEAEEEQRSCSHKIHEQNKEETGQGK